MRSAPDGQVTGEKSARDYAGKTTPQSLSGPAATRKGLVEGDCRAGAPH